VARERKQEKCPKADEKKFAEQALGGQFTRLRTRYARGGASPKSGKGRCKQRKTGNQTSLGRLSGKSLGVGVRVRRREGLAGVVPKVLRGSKPVARTRNFGPERFESGTTPQIAWRRGFRSDHSGSNAGLRGETEDWLGSSQPAASVNQ